MAFLPSPKSLLLALGALFFLSQLHFTLAALYKVADMNGKWGVENYFQAGDSLSFSHHTDTGGEVHEVSWKEYKACHTRNPMKTYKKGDNVAEVGGKSTYYFISGDKALCKSGRKLMVVILAGSPASPPTTVAAPPATPTATAPTPPPATPAPASPPPPATPAPASPPPPATPPPATPPTSAPPATPPTTPPPATSPPATPPATPPTTPSPSAPPATPPSSPAPASSSPAGPPTPPTAPAPATPPPTPSAAASLPILLTWSIIAIALSTSLTLLA